MTKGDAKLWKDQFLKNANAMGRYDLGTWNSFHDELKKAFKPFDASKDGLEKLISLRKGDNTIKDYIKSYSEKQKFLKTHPQQSIISEGHCQFLFRERPSPSRYTTS